MLATKHLVSLAVAAAVGCVVGFGVADLPVAHAAAPADTVTVFVDATLGFRKDHMARQLTQSHAEYAKRGYRFAGMQAFTENGDLQGMFVTYTRD